MEFQEEDIISLLNRLLEQLHPADFSKCSKIELTYVASGAQHVDTIQTQHVYTSTQQVPAEDSAPASLPATLATAEAMALWQKAQQAGYVDEQYRPLLSRTQSALLADAMAVRLGIREKWKAFEALWHRKNMYRDHYEALNQNQSLAFQDELKQLFG
jgi:hypothetical protein